MIMSMVGGEARARRNPRKGEVAVFPLWPSCRTATPGTAEDQRFRRAQAQVARGTGRGSRGFENKIKCVEYAVNPALEEAYNEKREEMTRRLRSAGINEQLLFHGTSFASSEAILRENFRLDKVGAEKRVPIHLICLKAMFHPTSCSATCTHVPPLGDRRKRQSRCRLVPPGAAWCRLVPPHIRGSVNLSQASTHMCTRPELTAGGVGAMCVCTLPPCGQRSGQRTVRKGLLPGIIRQRLLLHANAW